MKYYEIQLGRIADGTKDSEKDYQVPALMIVKARTYPSIKEIEKYFFDTIKSLNCDCVYGITPLKEWELKLYKETYDKYPLKDLLKYSIKISYSWGDEEEPYGEYNSEEEAYKAMCELASKEAYIQNENFEVENSCVIYFDAYNKEIDLHYDNDDTWCYYRVKLNQ